LTLSTHLKLPFILPAQAGKHITHNEAIAAIDTLAQLAVLDTTTTAPPGSPGEGDRYLVAAGATGDWVDHDGEIAVFLAGDWSFHAPAPGWLAYDLDEDELLVFDGTAWTTLARTDDSMPMLGINTDPDATNRLAVKSDAVLLGHDDVTPGTGSMRLVLDKSAAAGTASLLLQDNASGRAEIGLTGDDKLHVKLSADGSTWSEILVADPATGRIGMGTTAPDAQLTVSSNAAALPVPNAGTILHFGQADSTPCVALLDAFSAFSIFAFRRTNGTAASPAAVGSGQGLGILGWYSFGGTTYVASATIEPGTEEAHSETARGTNITFRTTAPGAIARTERLRITGDGALVHRANAQTVVSADSHLQLRSYTVAGLPGAGTAGQLIYVSNGTANKRLAVSDGTNWRWPDGAIVS
jgi:hypothetical protein